MLILFLALSFFQSAAISARERHTTTKRSAHAANRNSNKHQHIKREEHDDAENKRFVVIDDSAQIVEHEQAASASNSGILKEINKVGKIISDNAEKVSNYINRERNKISSSFYEDHHEAAESSHTFNQSRPVSSTVIGSTGENIRSSAPTEGPTSGGSDDSSSSTENNTSSEEEPEGYRQEGTPREDSKDDSDESDSSVDVCAVSDICDPGEKPKKANYGSAIYLVLFFLCLGGFAYSITNRDRNPVEFHDF